MSVAAPVSRYSDVERAFKDPVFTSRFSVAAMLAKTKLDTGIAQLLGAMRTSGSTATGRHRSTACAPVLTSPCP